MNIGNLLIYNSDCGLLVLEIDRALLECLLRVIWWRGQLSGLQSLRGGQKHAFFDKGAIERSFLHVWGFAL